MENLKGFGQLDNVKQVKIEIKMNLFSEVKTIQTLVKQKIVFSESGTNNSWCI